MRIKICGITSAQDALTSIDAGADALGFNFFPPSPRSLSIQSAAPWIQTLPPFISLTAILVNPTHEQITTIEKYLPFDLWQLHGHESPHFCRALHPRRVIKAVAIHSASEISSTLDYPVTALLIDTPSSQYGGTGKKGDWTLARELVQKSPLPVILSGGLTPDNVAEAIATVRPFGIDVCSGVESSPGKKDPAKLRDFILAAREAAAKLT
ncbi:MAG: phosphoribosylanthranilate isomerase [Methylacidiphilales bacterium]|nr:phosphoribosylanthranilate isomerase [Candidatus Methylacidiphilales bacterium]MDW8349669.1 phosphoribosylanthranilate isomerase [Verrucomicrobiae bacterium]